VLLHPPLRLCRAAGHQVQLLWRPGL
jgi:hypothetical protein